MVKFGLDYLCGAKYGDLILREHPTGWAAGFFLELDGIGNSSKVIEALAQTGRCPIFRIHGIWKDEHDFSLRDANLAIIRAKVVQAFAVKFPNIRFEYSPFCEHEISDVKVVDKILGDCQKAAPKCTIVNSIHGRGALSKKYKNEVHGIKAKPTVGRYNFSFDGSSQVDSDVHSIKEQHRSAEVIFFWDPLFNLRWETNDKTKRRDRKAKPSSELIDSLIFQSTDKGQQFISEYPKDFIFKTHGDFHLGDAKSNRPVIITKHKVDFIDLKLLNGQVVQRLPLKSRYEDGVRWRYYAQDWGYQIAEKARRISGGPHVLVCIGNEKPIVVNAGFRENDFRKE